jgi:hypothetical protein
LAGADGCKSKLRRFGDGIVTSFEILAKNQANCRVKSWEAVAEKLSKAGFSWGYASAVDCEGPESYSDDF